MNEECDRYFTATVFSGLGEGEFYVSIYAKRFREKLGITPYPGTLNTRIEDPGEVRVFNECLKNAKNTYIEPPVIPGARLGAVYAYRAEIEGLDAWIVRPVITAYKGDVVEFISEEYLRGLLFLNDGDKVRFRIIL
ncbi:MAG: CTP-dependent riboflavin kinase [Desulfurococcales archaeon]|nr:CTP-dependent riboflavin kinase [Desulfurococcales archaeon]